MLEVERWEVKRTGINTEYGDAEIENGAVVCCGWGVPGLPALDFSDLTRDNWIDLMTFLSAVWQELVGKHGVIMVLTGKYIWVEFEEEANLGAILEEYKAKYEARFGVAPNCVTIHPTQAMKGEWPTGLRIIHQEITPVGTFKIGYEEPKDAEASVSD